LQRAVEDLDNQIALLRARGAAFDKSKAVLTSAQIDFSRARQLLRAPAESREESDQAQKELSTADAEVNEALAAAQPTGLRSPKIVGSSSLTVG
jgi:membrane fusion protein (multidrug efflux system)